MNLYDWRVGRGTKTSPANRGVDLLLSNPGDQLSRSLASSYIYDLSLQPAVCVSKGAR